MDPCVPQNSYKTAIIRCPLFSSEASFCQSPGFHSSAMVVSCWERVEIWGAHWPALLSMKLMIKTLFQIQCFPNILLSPHLGISSGSFTWAECRLICFTIFRKALFLSVSGSDPWRSLIYLCSHQIPHGRSRTAEFPVYVYLITSYLTLIPPAQRLLSILRSDSVSK